MIKRILLALVVLLLLAAAVTYINGDRYRVPVQVALESGLHRKVEIGRVGFRLLPTPALTISDVTIGEDPAIGREPVAYVTTLRAMPRLLSLISGPLAFSSVTLDEASLNVSRTDREQGGVQWNFSSLARSGVLDAFPSIHLRGGRINFKSGDTKSVFYLLETDIDLWPPDTAKGPWTLKIAGQPARTDRRAHGFGSFVARGQWHREDNTVTIDATLEKSELSDMLTLFEGKQSGLQGTVQGNVHVAGPLRNGGIAGRVNIAELHGFSNPPPGGKPWVFEIGGAVNVPGQTVELRAVLGGKQQPLLDIRYRISEYLARPNWGVTVLLGDMPLGPLAPLARNMGVDLPDGLAVGGVAHGAFGWSVPAGVPQMNGAVRISGVTLATKGTQPLRVAVADLKFAGSTITLEPAVIASGDTETANVAGSYDFSSRALRARLASEGMSVAAVRKAISVARVPLLGEATAGIWSGEIDYLPGGWMGNLKLRDVDVPFEAFSAPLHVTSAEAQLMGRSINIKHFNVNVGNVEAQGEYHYEEGADSPHKFRLILLHADAEDLEKLLQPALHRGSLLNYAFNFGRPPQPEWLRDMHASGTIQAGTLELGGTTWSRVKANIVWNAMDVRLTGLEGQAGPATMKGEAAIDLARREPAYELTGTLAGFAWREGTLAAEGTLSASGAGRDLPNSLKARGEFRGRTIDLGSVGRFRTVGGHFEWAWNGHSPKLSLTELKLQSEGATMTGGAETRDNGEVVLQATDGTRQIVASGALMRGEPLKIVP